jgi:RHS repeat-associated protein
MKDTFNAEDQIAQISNLNNATPFVTYTYPGDGTWVRKTNADGTSTDYETWEGQTVADVDHNGNATDYFYANGQKIAMIPAKQPLIQTHGNNDGYWSLYRWDLPTPQDASGGNYIIKAGDQLCFRQKSNQAFGGPIVWLANGSSSVWSWTASDGQLLNRMPPSGGAWVNRCADLTQGGQNTGVAISILSVFTDSPTPAGPWDLSYADMAIQSTEGSVTQLIGSNPPPVYGGFNGNADRTATAVALFAPVTSADASAATHYFISDQLGTAQLEFASGGWPVWQGQFAPYGGELNAQKTQNNYKFTGKERDAESGLDYFGARYYSSNMGRWMSPDWAAKPEAVPYSDLANPQSLNLYGYVNNNPLSKTDPDGHCCLDEFKAIFYAKGSVGPGVGSEVKLTKYLSAGVSAKAVLETKATSSGAITTAVGEVKGGVKVGPADLSVKVSAEAQVLKNGALDPKAPELKTTLPSIGGGSAEGTPNEISVSGHAGAFGGEVGIDVDKVKELGTAVNQSLSDLGGYLRDKVTPDTSQPNIPPPVPKNPF